jgi:hypothetical protein
LDQVLTQAPPMNNLTASRVLNRRERMEALGAMALPLVEAIAVRPMKARRRRVPMQQEVLRYRKGQASDKTLSLRYDVIYIS